MADATPIQHPIQNVLLRKNEKSSMPLSSLEPLLLVFGFTSIEMKVGFELVEKDVLSVIFEEHAPPIQLLQ